VWLAVAVVGTGVWAVVRRDPQNSLRDSAATMLLILYLGFAVSFALHIRCGRGSVGPAGAWLLLMTILVTKASDIGAYFVGTFIGRHKLIPGISPGKSVEGAVGGLIASALVALLFASLCTDVIHSLSIRNHPTAISPIVRALLFGLALSAAGQIGDLVESCFKRDSGVKDSSNLIPRYGGILDMIDSPVFAMPVAWFLLTTVWNVV